MRSLNLASHPFRNERLPKVLLGLASVLLAALCAWHARKVYLLLPRQTSALARDVQALEDESRRYRDEATGLRAVKANPADSARWTLLKELVDRRVFSWTRLLTVLEQSMPLGVRLESVAPSVDRGQFVLGISAVARTIDDGFELIKTLEARPEFEDVDPQSRRETEEGIALMMTMKYHPSAAPAPSPSAAPAPAPSPAEGEGPAAGPSPAEAQP